MWSPHNTLLIGAAMLQLEVGTVYLAHSANTSNTSCFYLSPPPAQSLYTLPYLLFNILFTLHPFFLQTSCLHLNFPTPQTLVEFQPSSC